MSPEPTGDASAARTSVLRRAARSGIALDPVPSPPGAGEIGRLPVWQRDGQTHGVWEMTPGVLRDVPGPESVCLLSGRATVQIRPSGEVVELQTGDVFAIDEGEIADWTVTETVRKFFVVNR